MKLFCALAAVLVIVLLCVSFCKSASGTRPDADTFEKRVLYLSNYGIDISECEETSTEVLLPDKDDSELIKYNSLQTCCGFDLLTYSGCVVSRYSYSLPDAEKIISLIVADGSVVGGDILDKENYSYMPLCGGETDGNITDR